MRDRDRDLIVVVTLFGAVVAALSLGYQDPGATTIVLSVTAAATLLVWGERRDLVLGATGVLLGPAVELAATASGLWRYAAPSFGTVPLWIVPMWWIYAVTVPRLVGALSREPLRPSAPVLAAVAIAVEVAWLCAFGAARPDLALVGTLLLLVLFLSRHHRVSDVITLIVCGAIGPAAEAVPVAFGAWSYADSRLLGMPIWLPPGYAVFGSLVVHLGLAWDARRVPAREGAVTCA